MFSLPIIQILLAFISSFLLVLYTTPRVINVAKNLRLFDKPGRRSSHQKEIPVVGGIVIFCVFILSVLVWGGINISEFSTYYIKMQYIFVSLLIIFFTGVLDDLVSLSPLKKLVGQITSIFVLIYFCDLKIDNFHGVLGIYEIHPILCYLFTCFVVIVITNGFNLIDGVDGLAAGIGIISSLCFGVIAVLMSQYDMAVMAFTLIGVLFGFLKYNFHPAKIFMGDTGSLVVGMILSILAINLIDNGFLFEQHSYVNKGPFLAILFLSLPLFDSLRVFCVRVLRKKHPLKPARDHIHHALLDLDLDHGKTSMLLYLFSIVTISVFSFLISVNISFSIFLLAIFMNTVLFLPFYILSKRNKK